MFKDARFNGDHSKWNVSKVASFAQMFFTSPFQGDISQWSMLDDASFVSIFDTLLKD